MKQQNPIKCALQTDSSRGNRWLIYSSLILTTLWLDRRLRLTASKVFSGYYEWWTTWTMDWTIRTYPPPQLGIVTFLSSFAMSNHWNCFKSEVPSRNCSVQVIYKTSTSICTRVDYSDWSWSPHDNWIYGGQWYYSHYTLVLLVAFG